MSETEVKQDLLDIRYFAERMLKGLYEHNAQAQTETLFELARLIAIHHKLNPAHILTMLVSIWNGATFELRGKGVTDDVARQTVFRVIGEIFGKYDLPDPGYEEDEL